MNADRAVMTCAILTAGSTVGSAVTPKSMGGRDIGISPRLLIATGLTFTALSLLAEVAPGVAVPLAAGIALTAVMWYGLPVLDKSFNTKG